MKRKTRRLDAALPAEARDRIRKVYLPRITRCLGLLSEEAIWWRPNPASNSAGNMALHLEGNIRQWIVAGLGGAADRRQRDLEFSERGPIPRRVLLSKLRKAVTEACRVLVRMSHSDLERAYSIQGFRVTGSQAISHVTEHFAYHAGQIIYLTKLKRGKDLAFTKLPGERRPAKREKDLPSI